MSMWSSGRPHPLDDYAVGTRDSAVVRFFNAVYAWMAVGLAVTGCVAWWVAHNGNVLRHVYSTGALIGLFIAELVLVIVISSAIRRINATAATALFMLYAALNGILLAGIFLMYTLPSVAGAFGACAAMFAVMSLYGMFTKADLTKFGKILFMALIGLVVATVINIFVANTAFTWIVSYAGVLIFAGLTAYDTQRLSEIAMQTQGDPALAARLSVNGALILYLDFINMFLFLLRIMGDRRQ
jgi:uncharacterized protein